MRPIKIKQLQTLQTVLYFVLFKWHMLIPKMQSGLVCYEVYLQDQAPVCSAFLGVIRLIKINHRYDYRQIIGRHKVLLQINDNYQQNLIKNSASLNMVNKATTVSFEIPGGIPTGIMEHLSGGIPPIPGGIPERRGGGFSWAPGWYPPWDWQAPSRGNN